MKSGPGRAAPSSSSALYSCFMCRKKRGGWDGGRRRGGRPLPEIGATGRRGGGIGAESARKLAPRRASQAPALESEREIEIILIRSDSACQ